MTNLFVKVEISFYDKGIFVYFKNRDLFNLFLVEQKNEIFCLIKIMKSFVLL